MVCKYVQTGSLLWLSLFTLKRIFFCDFLSVCVVESNKEYSQFMTLMSVVLQLKEQPLCRAWFYFTVIEGSGNTALSVPAAVSGSFYCKREENGDVCVKSSVFSSPELWFGDLRTRVSGIFKEKLKLSAVSFLPMQRASAHVYLKIKKYKKKSPKILFSELTLIFWYCMPCWGFFYYISF